MIVRFEDVITRITGNVDRYNTDLEYYVGGDQYDSSSLTIERRGDLKKDVDILGFKFHFPFKSGDVLLMARNPHLRKAGQVFFDGLCSDASYILRTKDEKRLRQNYIPIILQSNHFWDWFESHKTGGITFLLNWGMLKGYEFDLPNSDVQDSIMEKVWAAYKLKQSYQKLIIATDEMVKSRFIEEFQGKGYKSQKLNSFAQVVTGSTPSRSVSDYWLNGAHPWVSAQDMGDKFVDATAELVSDSGMATCKLIPAGSLLYVCRGSIGVMSINRIDCATNQSICSAICDDSICKTEYLYYWLLYHEDEINSLGEGTSFKSLSQKTFASLKIQIPPIEEQLRFIAITRQADKSKFELKQAIEKIDKVMRAMLQ
jgi:type I restriction enzyme S subunit